MNIGRWHVQYLGTYDGDFDTGWKYTLRRRGFYREEGGKNVIGHFGPFFFFTRISR